MKSLLLVILTSCLAAHLCAEEREFPEHNFRITPPAGWNEITEQLPSGDARAAFAKPDRTAVVAVAYDNVQGTPAVNDKFAADYDRGTAQTSGGKRISGRFLEHQGMPAYESVFEMAVQGKTFSFLSRVIPVDGRIYRIQATSFDGTPATDHAELQRAVESFRLLNRQPK